MFNISSYFLKDPSCTFSLLDVYLIVLVKVLNKKLNEGGQGGDKRARWNKVDLNPIAEPLICKHDNMNFKKRYCYDIVN